MARVDASRGESADEIGLDEAVRTLLLLMPRLVGRAKRVPIPPELESFSLAPRHLSLLAYLLFDGPTSVSELAGRLEVAPATVSLMVSDLSRQGILERREDPADHRRTIVAIADEHQASVGGWLAHGIEAWRSVLEPLAPAERSTVVNALLAYEREVVTRAG